MKASIIAISLVMTLVLAVPGMSARVSQAQATHADSRQAQDQTVGDEGCQPPADFALTYRQGPAHADWGGAVWFSLAADGGYSLEIQARGRGGPGSWEVKARGFFNRRELEKIYQAVNEQGFWSLRRYHRNPDVMDGTVGSLRVRARGREHTVVMSNMELPQVTVILVLLRRALPQDQRCF